MKKYLFLFGCFLALSISDSFAQSFSYNYREYGVRVIPTFDSFSPIGKRSGYIYIADQDYFRDVFNKIIQKHLPQETLAMLSKRGSFKILFKMGTSGKILYMEFFIKKDILVLITDEQLRELYNGYKEAKFDMAKANFQGYFDYCTMSIPAYRQSLAIVEKDY